MSRSSYPQWLGQPHAVDTVVAVLRDRADDDEKRAAEMGASRLSASWVRTLRHYAHTLAEHGSGAQLDPIAPPSEHGEPA